MKVSKKMMGWLRRVTPDLFLAAVVALLVTLALNTLEDFEGERITAEVRVFARDGLTIDERIHVFDQSIRRSIFVYQPMLVAAAATIVGIACRNRRWAWLTAVLAVIPALLMGGGFFIDAPIAGSSLLAAYVAMAVFLASISVAVRNRLMPVVARRSP